MDEYLIKKDQYMVVGGVICGQEEGFYGLKINNITDPTCRQALNVILKMREMGIELTVMNINDWILGEKLDIDLVFSIIDMINIYKKESK